MNWKNKVLKKIQTLNEFPYFTKNTAELEYFLGYNGSNGFLLILSPTEFIFLTDGRYFEAYSRFYPDNIGLISGEKKITDWVREKLKTSQKSLQINPEFFNYAEILSYRQKLKPIKLKPSKNQIAQIRALKSREEIQVVKKAIQITEEGLSYIFNLIQENMTEKQVAAELEYYLKLKGADELSFPVIVLFGENSAFPHGVPSNRKLKSGDVVLIDVGIKIDHYCSDMTRTFVYGKPTEEFKSHYNYLLQFQKESIQSIRAGGLAFELDEALRRKLKKIGLEKYYTHSLGHGVGIEVHEEPYLSYLKPEVKLQKGALFTIEPGIYLPGCYGIRIEDMIYIDMKGNTEILTSFPKELLAKI